MPYKSRAQQRLFHHLVAQGKLAPEVAEEYDTASKGKKLPQYVKRKAFGGQVEAKEGTHCPACDYPLDAIPVAMDAGEGCPRCGYGDAKDVPQRARGGEMLPKQGDEMMEPTRYRARGGDVKRRPSPPLRSEESPLSHLFRRMEKEDTMTSPDESIPMTRRGWFQMNRQDAWRDDPKSRTPEMAKLIQRFAQHESEVDPEYAEQWRKNTSGRMGDVKMADQYAHGGEVQCAHCGSVEFVPLKAMGGEVGGPLHGDMKELYPSKKDAGAHLDDGKIRSFGKMFVHAIKHRRR